jgi:hypothetical protein
MLTTDFLGENADLLDDDDVALVVADGLNEFTLLQEHEIISSKMNEKEQNLVMAYLQYLSKTKGVPNKSMDFEDE